MKISQRAARRAATSAAVALCILTPATFFASPVSAATGVATQIFATSEVDTDRPAGAVEGTLRISIGTDGSILGYFRAANDFHLIDVHGSLSGTRIALQIGDETLLTGTYVEGKIVASRLVGRDYDTFTGVRTTTQAS